MTRNTEALTEERVLSIITSHDAYTINPWRAPRQHQELLESMVKRRILFKCWGRKHCVEFRLRKRHVPA